VLQVANYAAVLAETTVFELHVLFTKYTEMHICTNKSKIMFM